MPTGIITVDGEIGIFVTKAEARDFLIAYHYLRCNYPLNEEQRKALEDMYTLLTQLDDTPPPTAAT